MSKQWILHRCHTKIGRGRLGILPQSFAPQSYCELSYSYCRRKCLHPNLVCGFTKNTGGCRSTSAARTWTRGNGAVTWCRSEAAEGDHRKIVRFSPGTYAGIPATRPLPFAYAARHPPPGTHRLVVAAVAPVSTEGYCVISCDAACVSRRIEILARCCATCYWRSTI